MAVKIRLSRFGKKDNPTYRIVVCDARTKREGKFLEIIGNYNPKIGPKINDKRYDYWISVGAQPTKAVLKLIENVTS
ncbi:30S ribosomal protein S16 [Candidatus Curtissbacteria bacterium RBG_16_39_7]|uniref:Small ribosomal subunit protein bS16 n=1 Tax=Candidatus Curtissbacteria bacterium RBG_16_39_7 TaxID=1797707 RepID=A0A1F5G326_9BACT|nr:MAG: 30S ribosomal protein S16 [Candidatus Curtissbacteria bacterium RBG_16_39_7]